MLPSLLNDDLLSPDLVSGEPDPDVEDRIIA
jgi:hypothetical protein